MTFISTPEVLKQYEVVTAKQAQVQKANEALKKAKDGYETKILGEWEKYLANLDLSKPNSIVEAATNLGQFIDTDEFYYKDNLMRTLGKTIRADWDTRFSGIAKEESFYFPSSIRNSKCPF